MENASPSPERNGGPESMRLTPPQPTVEAGQARAGGAAEAVGDAHATKDCMTDLEQALRPINDLPAEIRDPLFAALAAWSGVAQARVDGLTRALDASRRLCEDLARTLESSMSMNDELAAVLRTSMKERNNPTKPGRKPSAKRVQALAMAKAAVQMGAKYRSILDLINQIAQSDGLTGFADCDDLRQQVSKEGNPKKNRHFDSVVASIREQLERARQQLRPVDE